MDEDAIFDAAMSRTTTSKRSRDHDRSRDRDRHRDRDRDRDRDRGRDEGKRSRTSQSDGEAAVWKPSGPLEDQATMFQQAPPSSHGHSRGGAIAHPGDNRGGRGGGRRGDGPAPELFSVHHGEVRSIQSYGVFVNMPGFKDGLVHISQLVSYRVEDPNEVVSQGQRVWVKVIEIDTNNKVSLSMKMVNQQTGKDEDPDHFEALEAQGRKGGGGQRGPMKFSEDTHLGSANMGTRHKQSPCINVARAHNYLRSRRLLGKFVPRLKTLPVTEPFRSRATDGWQELWFGEKRRRR